MIASICLQIYTHTIITNCILCGEKFDCQNGKNLPKHDLQLNGGTFDQNYDCNAGGT